MRSNNSSLIVKIVLAIAITVGVVGLGAILLTTDDTAAEAGAQKQVTEELNVFTVYQAPVGAEPKGVVTSEHPEIDQFTDPVTLNQ